MKIASHDRQISVLVMLTVIVSAAASGCSSLTGEKAAWKKLPWIGEKEEEPYPNPRKMAVTWAPDVIMRTGATPTRGFGGRVFFYDEKTRPVPVEGELAIQAFIAGPDGKPVSLKRYGFTAEQFTRHYSQSDLGASYSIWIPWDAVGGNEAKITLVPSFRTKQGKKLNGTASVVHLPGKNGRLDEPRFQPLNGEMYAQRASMGTGAWTNAQADPELFRQSGLTTTTIPVHQPRRPSRAFRSTGVRIAGNRALAPNRPAPNRPNQAIKRTAESAAGLYGVQPASATSAIPPSQAD